VIIDILLRIDGDIVQLFEQLLLLFVGVACGFLLLGPFRLRIRRDAKLRDLGRDGDGFGFAQQCRQDGVG